MPEGDQRSALERARELEKKHDLNGAVSLARRAISDDYATPLQAPRALRLLAVRLLVKIGALSVARRRIIDYGFNGAEDREIRQIEADILRAEALSLPPSRRLDALNDAVFAYLELFTTVGDRRAGINAASLSALKGDMETARPIAKALLRTLPSIATSPHIAYLRNINAAQSHLILGQVDEAANSISAASSISEIDALTRAPSLRQLRQLIQKLDADPSICDPLAPAPVMHYCGHLMADPEARRGRLDQACESELRSLVRDQLKRIRPSAAFGSLACGADIIIAEECIRASVPVHVILPFRERDFIDTSVLYAGYDWVIRYHACREAAASVSTLSNQPHLKRAIDFSLTSRQAMGRAILHANMMEGEAVQLAVSDQSLVADTWGTARDIAHWEETGRVSYKIDAAPFIRNREVSRDNVGQDRVEVAVLFADVKGFSQLDDFAVPVFVDRVLGRIGDVLGTVGHVELANTWGDGIFVVFSSAAAAAEAALRMQEEMVRVKRTLSEDFEHTGLRIALHYGLCYKHDDPILKRPNYFGEAVSRTARIEPVTPTGSVYLTEMFAAILAIAPQEDYDVDFVGSTATAKNFGIFDLYRLRRRLPDVAGDKTASADRAA
ncbi:MAG: adenylate/guanylate cyclase domain-containing protein [Pseudomonadota bacterium]